MTEQTASNDRRLAMMDDEIDLRRLWALLVDHLWLIGGTTVLALVLGLLYGVLATPIYKANALLQIEPKQGGMPGFEELNNLFSSESSTDAQIQIIRSRMVLGSAVDQLNMTISLTPDRLPVIGGLGAPEPVPAYVPVPLFAGYRNSETYVTIKTFVVPDKYLGKPFTLRANEQGQPALYFDGELIASGPADQKLRALEGRLRLKIGQWHPGQEEMTLVKNSRLTVINRIRDHLSISQQGEDSGILSMSYTGPRPDRIKSVLNAIADAYLMQNIKRNAAEAANSLEFLNKQLPKIKEKLNAAENELNKYRTKKDSVDLSLETQTVLQRLVAIESKLNELKVKESEIASRFTKEHPAYQTLLAQRKDLEQEKARINEKINKLPRTQQQVLRLMRDVAVNQQIYVNLLNKVQELRIMKASTVGNVRVIDHAVVQPEPVKPKRALLAALAAILGLMASIGYVLLRAALHRGLESPDQLEEQGLAVYAAIPLSEQQARDDRLAMIRNRRSKQRRKRHRQRDAIRLLATSDPADLAVEALRSLRTSLHFATMEASNKVLMISGPSPEVGKSFVTANLAAVLAQAGQKVVVVDGDMRRGHLHRYFGSDGQVGLSGILSGQVALEDVVTHTETENLDFLARGQVPPNPSELLMHPRFTALMEQLSGQYDLVLVDTPPILAVTDAAIVGQLAGTSLIVARYGTNSVKEVDVSVGRFEQNRVEIKGVILNCIERRASNEYGYYTYRYGSSKDVES